MNRLRWMLFLAFGLVAAVALNPASRPMLRNQFSILGGGWTYDLIDNSGRMLSPDLEKIYDAPGPADQTQLISNLHNANDHALQFYDFAVARDTPQIWGLFVRSLVGSEIAHVTGPQVEHTRLLVMKGVRRGRALEPKNLFFPLVEGSVLLVQGKDTEAAEVLKLCPQCTFYDDYYKEEYNLYAAALERQGMTTAIPKLTAAAMISLPEYAVFQQAAKKVGAQPFPGTRLEFANGAGQLAHFSTDIIGIFVARNMIRFAVSDDPKSVLSIGDAEVQTKFQSEAVEFDRKQKALGRDSDVATLLSESERLANAVHGGYVDEMDWSSSRLPVDLPSAALAALLSIPAVAGLGALWLRVPRPIASQMFPYLLASLGAFVIVLSDHSNYPDFTAFNLCALLATLTTLFMGNRAARLVSGLALVLFGFMTYEGYGHFGFEMGATGLAFALVANLIAWGVGQERRATFGGYVTIATLSILGISSFADHVYLAPMLVFAVTYLFSRSSKFEPVMSGFSPVLFLVLTATAGTLFLTSQTGSGHDMFMNSLSKSVGLVLVGSFPFMFLSKKSLVASVSVALGLFSTTFVIATGFALRQEAVDTVLLNNFMHSVDQVRAKAGVTFS